MGGAGRRREAGVAHRSPPPLSRSRSRRHTRHPPIRLLHRIVVFPALSRPSTRMRASWSPPKRDAMRESHRPMVAESGGAGGRQRLRSGRATMRAAAVGACRRESERRARAAAAKTGPGRAAGARQGRREGPEGGAPSHSPRTAAPRPYTLAGAEAGGALAKLLAKLPFKSPWKVGERRRARDRARPRSWAAASGAADRRTHAWRTQRGAPPAHARPRPPSPLHLRSPASRRRPSFRRTCTRRLSTASTRPGERGRGRGAVAAHRCAAAPRSTPSPPTLSPAPPLSSPSSRKLAPTACTTSSTGRATRGGPGNWSAAPTSALWTSCSTM